MTPLLVLLAENIDPAYLDQPNYRVAIIGLLVNGFTAFRGHDQTFERVADK